MTKSEERENTGRPPMFDEPMKKTSVSIPQHYAEYLEALGFGQLSPGVREVTEVYQMVRSLRDELVPFLQGLDSPEATELVQRITNPYYEEI